MLIPIACNRSRISVNSFFCKETSSAVRMGREGQSNPQFVVSHTALISYFGDDEKAEIAIKQAKKNINRRFLIKKNSSDKGKLLFS